MKRKSTSARIRQILEKDIGKPADAVVAQLVKENYRQSYSDGFKNLFYNVRSKVKKELNETKDKAKAQAKVDKHATVVAKTVRDLLMARLAVRHPGYGWESNMGYGTPDHLAGLETLGPCRHHRRTFGPISQLRLL